MEVDPSRGGNKEWIDNTEKGEERQREKQTPRWAGSPMQDSIPGPRDHDLSQSQTVNLLSHTGTPIPHFIFG